jgi:biotin synthase
VEALSAVAAAAENGEFRRVCIQALNYPAVFPHLQAIVKQLKADTGIPVSVSCQPIKPQNIQLLKDAGANRLGIALDAATEEIFSKVKGADAGGAYSWADQFVQLDWALHVFGKGNVSTHLIVGLGETEKQAVELIQRCVDMDVLPALFAFTPIRGTALQAQPQPQIETYRRVQLARHLIVHKLTRFERMRFGEDDKIIDYGIGLEALESVISTGAPFQTSGCPDCNRPFYNEKPSGPLYNYPTKPSKKEIQEIKKQTLPA